MKKAWKIYQLLNVLSLDVAAGSVVSALFFARILRVHLLVWGVAGLALTVWIIYTVDHLIDARRIPHIASSHRHRFHQKHFTVLSIFLIAAVLADGVIITFLRKPVLYSGLALAGAVVLYFVFQRALRSVKEVCGAALYVVGVLLPAWSLTSIHVTPPEEMIIAEFSITVLCNLLLFSFFDHHADLQDRNHSMVTMMGPRISRILLGALFLVNGILLVVQLLSESESPLTALVILLMNAVLVVLLLFRERFEVDDRYRLIGDAVFLLPVIYLLA